MKRILLTSILSIVSFCLYAVEWTEFYRDTKVAISIRTDIKMTDNKVWFKWQYLTKELQDKFGGVDFSVQYTYYNYTFTETSDIRSVFYDANGEVINSYDNSKTYQYSTTQITPGTLAEVCADAAKEYKKTGKVEKKAGSLSRDEIINKYNQVFVNLFRDLSKNGDISLGTRLSMLDWMLSASTSDQITEEETTQWSEDFNALKDLFLKGKLDSIRAEYAAIGLDYDEVSEGNAVADTAKLQQQPYVKTQWVLINKTDTMMRYMQVENPRSNPERIRFKTVYRTEQVQNRISSVLDDAIAHYAEFVYSFGKKYTFYNRHFWAYYDEVGNELTTNYNNYIFAVGERDVMKIFVEWAKIYNEQGAQAVIDKSKSINK